MKSLTTALLLLTSSLAQAGITVSPMVGLHVFDSDLDVENQSEGSLALGYRLTPQVATELRYAQSNPDNKHAPGNARYETVTLDAYYSFMPERRLQPYALIGGGLARGTDQGHVQHTIANVAVGAFYRLADNLSLRAELRGVEDLQESNHDGIFSLGLLYAFGEHAVVRAAGAAPAAGDADHDGVLDGNDQCPGTPANAAVDARGCHGTRSQPVTHELKVMFDTNKAVVKPQYEDEIAALAKLLQETPDAMVEVQGHADSRGANAYNQKLSQARADAIADILRRRFGVAANRITARGYGESRPVADNATAEGRAINRRVLASARGEVKVIITR